MAIHGNKKKGEDHGRGRSKIEAVMGSNELAIAQQYPPLFIMLH